MAWNNDPPIEIYGAYLGRAGKARMFISDYDVMPDEIVFLPAAHSWWEPDTEAVNPDRGTMKIAAWLAKKNEWSEWPK